MLLKVRCDWPTELCRGESPAPRICRGKFPLRREKTLFSSAPHKEDPRQLSEHIPPNSSRITSVKKYGKGIIFTKNYRTDKTYEKSPLFPTDFQQGGFLNNVAPHHMA